MSQEKWNEAFNNCSNYRNFLKEQPIPDDQKIKAFVFSRESLEQLLAEADNKANGVRVYIGQQQYEGGGTAIKLYAVATVENSAAQYDDYNIPSYQEGVATSLADENDTILDEGIPCPSYCSSSNSLNS